MSGPISEDPILFEVLKSGLQNVAEEMALTLRKTAYSPNLRTRGDMTSVIFNAEPASVVQATRYAPPVHAGTVASIVPRVLQWYAEHNPKDTLQPGDMLCANDPFIGGTHRPDTTLIMPYYVSENLVGYVVNVVHHTDIGGNTRGGLAPDARDCFEEGLNIPPIKLVRNNEIDRQILTLICGNSRTPDDFAGDLRAQVAANITGGRRLNDLINRYGLSTVTDTMYMTLEYTRAKMRAIISTLPHGEFRKKMVLSPDSCTGGREVELCLSILHNDEKLTLDFTGTSAQIPGPRNATLANSITAILYVLKAMVGPEVPLNRGLLDPLKVILPAGTVINALPPVPTSLCWDISASLVELLISAFSEIYPESSAGASKGVVANYGFNGVDSKTGKTFVWYESMGGGTGACSTHDGIDGAQIHIQAGSPDVPCEEVEMAVPVRQVRLQFIEDSGGAGVFRGGLGLAREYEFLEDVAFSVTRFDPYWTPPGIRGGLSGARGRHVILGRVPAEQEIRTTGTVFIKAGERLRIETPGGGGFGDPLQRSLQYVADDVRNGKVSRKAARDVYKVVLSPGGEVDLVETNKLRCSMGEVTTWIQNLP